jgi:hypothetical protein
MQECSGMKFEITLKEVHEKMTDSVLFTLQVVKELKCHINKQIMR